MALGVIKPRRKGRPLRIVPRAHEVLDDPGQSLFNREINKAVIDAQEHFLASATLLTADVDTTETKVKHHRGEAPTGWFQVSPGATSVQQSKAPDSTYLYLVAGSAVTATLVVF
jgi:hypothetical protein